MREDRDRATRDRNEKTAVTQKADRQKDEVLQQHRCPLSDLVNAEWRVRVSHLPKTIFYLEEDFQSPISVFLFHDQE